MSLTINELERALSLALEDARVQRNLLSKAIESARESEVRAKTPPPPAVPAFPTALELAFEGGRPEVRRKLNDAAITLRRAAQLLRGRNAELAARCQGDADALSLLSSMIKRAEEPKT